MDDGLSAIRRKAGAGRPPPEIGAPTPIKLLRAALMQAGEDVAALTVIAGAADEARVTLDPLTEEIPDHALMALVEGPEGRYGLVTLDVQTVAALIETQTTGRVVPRPADPREPTRTDAIMCADFVDRVLELLEQRVVEAGLPLAPALIGYRYALALAERRAIAMTLDDIPYRRFTVPLDLGGGAKQGTFALILPFDVAKGPAARGDAAAFTETLAELVSESAVRLSATLARVELPLAQVTQLTAGSLLPLPRGALERVAIEDIEGRVVMHGRLGQAQGHRALRIGGAMSDDESGAGFGQTSLPPSTFAGSQDPLGDLGSVLASEPTEDFDPAALGDLGSFGDSDAGDDLPDLGDLSDLGLPPLGEGED